MCGIVGWIDFHRGLANESVILQTMADKLQKRGPDESGYWFSEHASFGHRRLVVVDPEGGRQPMIGTRGNNLYVLIYNGELYNTEEIRKLLLGHGHVFEGWSDTEVLLKAYMEWEEDCLARLNGIFAFAVWDDAKQKLFMARDRIGVKPLFYTQRDSSFLFASEIKGLLVHPMVPTEINQEGLAEIFAIGPARTPGHGVFAGISELKAGHCLVYDQNGTSIRQYWKLISHEHEDNFNKTVKSLRELVYDAVKRQLVSDVPLCTLLSGGLDSSIITAIAAKEESNSIKTFSIDYVDNDKYFRSSCLQPDSDSPWIMRVSEFLDTTHYNYEIDTPELVDALFPAVIARDLPGMTDVDSSLLLFSGWIKKHATVGISGECADEVFGGYPWFYSDYNQSTFPWSQRLDSRFDLLSDAMIDSIDLEKYVSNRYQEALDEVPMLNGEPSCEAQKRKLFYLNLTRWMPTLLDRKDRMSMAAGLELRVPFCDHRLVEYAWNIPWRMKDYQHREKGLLRLAMNGLLPEDVLWRKKSPYPKTHNPSFISSVSSLVFTLLNDIDSPLLPLINKSKVEKLARLIQTDINIPWFGQLMNAPQLLAYLIQVNFWLQEYKISIK